jgi:hypothetical protein
MIKTGHVVNIATDVRSARSKGERGGLAGKCEEKTCRQGMSDLADAVTIPRDHHDVLFV